MKNSILFISALLMVAPMPKPLLLAETYSIDWFTTDGGGGTSIGGPYSISGTTGQPDAGHLVGGNYTLEAGFWGIVAPIQAPEAPSLTIHLTSTNSVVVSWPSPSTGFVLQQNLNGVSSVNWSNAPGAIQDDGKTRALLVTPPVGIRIYRLVQQ